MTCPEDYCYVIVDGHPMVAASMVAHANQFRLVEQQLPPHVDKKR